MSISRDRFVDVLGAGRGSERHDPPPLTLANQLGLPWLAPGAADQLCADVAAGQLEEAARAISLYVTRLPASGGEPDAERVLNELLLFLCAQAQHTWRQTALSVWGFAGHPVFKVGEALSLNEGDVGGFLAIQLQVLAAAVGEDATRNSWTDTYSVARLTELANMNYVEAVCDYMGVLMLARPLWIAAPANRRRSVLKRWQREYEAYESAVKAATTRPFADVLKEIPGPRLAYALKIALNQSRRPSPTCAVDNVRERRSTYEQFILHELKYDVTKRA